jgi:hypothetical protein
MLGSEIEVNPEFDDDPISDEHDKRRKSLLLLIFICLSIVAGYFVQSTLAANISIGNGNQIEFGQGITQATACSGSTQLVLTPYSNFSNVSGGGNFHFSSIKVSNIPSSCNGAEFVLNAFGAISSSPVALFNSTSTNAVIANDAGVFRAGSGTQGMSVSTGNGTFTVTFTNPVALASEVSRLTIQSRSGTPLGIGDTGPGGGTIFYYSSAGFDCGPTHTSRCNYLEAAPSGWYSSSDPFLPWATGPGGQDSTDVPGIVNESTFNNASNAIGLGYKNSLAIVAQGNGPSAAAVVARAYNGGNLNDWYLPSSAELNQLCKYASGQAWTSDATVCTGSNNLLLGLMSAISFWSSSEKNSREVWLQYFEGGQGTHWKDFNYQVRPIRAF